MIINAYLNIKAFIPMHVIIFFSIYLSFYEKVMIISKYFELGLIKDELKINNFITYLYLRL